MFNDRGNSMEWLNESKRRYYRATVERDLIGDLVVVQEYGSLDSARGNRIRRPVTDYREADKVLWGIGQKRASHGYQMVA